MERQVGFNELSRSSALDLLRKWKKQNRAIQCCVYDVAIPEKWSMEACVIVRLESISDSLISLSAASMIPDAVGRYITATLKINSETKFLHSDASFLPEGDFDASLEILSRNASLCRLFARRPAQ